MQPTEEKYKTLVRQNADLRSRLEEAESVIDAIRNGEVDALIVKKDNEPQLYTLKSADHTYRIFIEKMNDGALTLNRQGIIVYCNSSFGDMLHVPISGLLGERFINIIPAIHKEEVSRLLQKAWHNDSKAEITFPGNGKPLPVLLSLSRLEIDGGESLSIIITDLSFQKEAQQQKKTLEQKDEFISIASHELKTPVTSIKGYIQLLRFSFKEEGNTRAEEMLGRADAQVNKLSKLIAELLDVRKIENGQLLYTEESFDLAELVKEMVQELLSFSNTHELHFTAGEDCMVYADRHKISQVVSNLIENAIKYSPAKSKVIIHVKRHDDKACCSVQDVGMGIPKDEQPKIFGRFYRVGSSVENTYSGLGLGLYISAEIIKKHNGKLVVESEYGKGSTFSFELPLIK
jgi:two-component system CheB/CheR fusion protein